MPKPADLAGRLSICTYYRGDPTDRAGTCQRGTGTYPSVTASEPDLPFFRYQPDNPHDSHYCGCYGWD